MRVLQVTDSLAAKFGGTAAACAELTNQLSRRGLDMSVITLGGSNGTGAKWALDSSVVARACSPTGPWRLGYCRDTAAILDSLPPPSVVHVHGLWRLHYLQAARFALARGIPLVISVHGMLFAGALRQRAALKRLGRWVFQDALLQHASCLHATADEEAEAIRRLGFHGAIAVVPWGVHAPDDGPARLPATSEEGPKRRELLYLGRLHPSKGLEPLLRAWAHRRPQPDAWHLVLAGYDANGYLATLKALAAELEIADTITFAGPVDGVAREQRFRQASVVVLPSPAENFGFVVPEALARGLPVIATQGAPWSTLASEACGWWVPPGEASLTAALDDAMSQSRQTLREMGERGRQLVRERFTWERVAAAMIDLYGWTLGRRAEPAFVQR
jgi:glycosyltransferase involved in cell wall biosynthesis